MVKGISGYKTPPNRVDSREEIISSHLQVWVGCIDTSLHHRMAPTASPPSHSSSYPGRWSPRLRMGGASAWGCSGQEVGGGDGSVSRMWTDPPTPGWTPPPAAGASAVALHQWTAESSGWMSPSGLSSPGHTWIPVAPSDGRRSSPQSTRAPSKKHTQRHWDSSTQVRTNSSRHFLGYKKKGYEIFDKIVGWGSTFYGRFIAIAFVWKALVTTAWGDWWWLTPGPTLKQQLSPLN